MGYKKTERNMTFAEADLKSSMKHNRSLKMMEKIDKIIKWPQIETILMKHYTIGTSSEGADAYPPMVLLKAFLLQKWFRIDSDPELENQINDRISFKKFLGLSFDKPSPDHSTFCRFRSRLSKNTMTDFLFFSRNKNKMIANWFKWEETQEPKFHAFSIPEYKEFEESGYTMELDELKFHCDSNWQWLCL